MTRQPHPAGLYVLFFTEMWERFSFYTMFAVFTFYMKDKNNGYPFLQENHSLINGFYVGTVYFTPFFGGMLADGKLGYTRAIILGAIIMGLGQILLSIDSLFFFFAGLLGLVLGNGLFKPNISVLVGKLYPPNDPRLDSAYTIFYMGINVGAFLAPIVAGIVRVYFNSYHAAFGFAGLGMFFSLILFASCQRWLIYQDHPSLVRAVKPPEEVPADVQRLRNLALLVVFAIVALFWMAFKQGGNTIPQWFKEDTDRTAPSWLPSWLLDKDGQITAEYFASLNPFYVITLSIPLAWLWLWLRSRGREPSTPAKIGLGMVLGALGFSLFVIASFAGADQGMLVSPWYIVFAYFFITTAELCLSPIGLSLVSKLASPKARSTWMGGWFAATAIGGYASGIIGSYWEEWAHSTFFLVLVVTCLGATAIQLGFFGLLSRAMPAPKPKPIDPLPETVLPTSLPANAP